MSKAIYIINGPNLNLLGKREPEIYGTTTLADIETMCIGEAEKIGKTVSFHQSNDEGKLVDLIQEARQDACALVINAGAYTHTSVAILDALQTLAIPIIEVHLSNIFSREEFRHHSYISPVARGVICGFGATGYSMAIQSLSSD
ncbi:MAG: type II 3-dehydroquinate dehydratase [Parvibaculales bacterium]